MSEPLYTIRTWDTTEQAYTPQAGLSVASENVPFRTLFTIYRELRAMGYSCYREPANHDFNDWCVLIERTDGKPPPDGSR